MNLLVHGGERAHGWSTQAPQATRIRVARRQRPLGSLLGGKAQQQGGHSQAQEREVSDADG